MAIEPAHAPTPVPPTVSGKPPEAAEPSADPPGKTFERPHPLTPLIRGWLVFVGLFYALVRHEVDYTDRGRLEFGDLGWVATVGAGLVVIAALSGLVGWYFTRFVIDDDELRIETGVLSKTSTRIPFERVQSVDIIQPFAARFFGLVELRIEVGAGHSNAKLRYLPRARATQLREYLLTRANGMQASVSDLGPNAVASAFTDASRDDTGLVTVSPPRLIGSFLLSNEAIIPIAVLLAATIVPIALGVAAFAIPVVFSMVISLGTLVSRRVISMFNFTLAESPRGLRVTRGLTNLTSQSVPLDRIQGIRICQSLLWRTPDWYRLDVEILGFGDSDSESNRGQATTVLLPAAGPAEVRLVLARLLPGFDLDSLEWHRSPRRQRWLRWYDHWTLRYAWNERAIVTEHGWVKHETEIVPHAKIQSVRIEQGPLQRRFGFADVHIQTPKGPVNAVARRVDAVHARALALTQLDRARMARIAAAGPPGPLLGQGGESQVYALDDGRVMRLYRTDPKRSGRIAQQLRTLYDGWSGVDIGVQLPRILQIGVRGGRAFSIDRRFGGEPFAQWLDTAGEEIRRPALLSYLDLTARLPELAVPVGGFTRLIGPNGPESFATLPDLLSAMLAGPLERSRATLAADGIDADAAAARVLAEVSSRVVTPVLVHGDVCPANAYVSIRADGRPVITGLGDFSPHTLVADPLIDLTGAIAFIELRPYPGAADDVRWLTEIAVERWGGSVRHWIGIYRRFYGLYLSDTFEADPACYAWCREQLRAPALDPVPPD